MHASFADWELAMNWESIGAIAEVVGVVAILVSIVYLATQVRQSNEIATAEAEREILQSWMHGLEGFVASQNTTEFFLKGLADFDALTSIEKTRLSYRLTELNMVYISALENEKKGLIAPHLVEAFGNVFFSYVNSRGGRQWWAMHREFFTNTDLVDERIANESDSFPSILESLPYHNLESAGKQ
jgi:hypothetical protein